LGVGPFETSRPHQEAASVCQDALAGLTGRQLAGACTGDSLLGQMEIAGILKDVCPHLLLDTPFSHMWASTNLSSPWTFSQTTHSRQ
jgi:hypothetical protein